MTTSLVRVLQHSCCLPDDDFIVLCLATNEDKNFLVVESYAGTGKTTLILDIIRRLDCEKCILLSFSRTAVKVARIRLVQETGQWLKTQTFDSLFLHLHGSRVKSDEASFQTYRDMVVHTTTEDLATFMCKTRYVNYEFAKLKYVFVDEAQDSPPEAFDFLNLCRKEGKQVIITGDRNQAIFRFMNTASLFDSIPDCYSVHHRLTTSRRCIQLICDFVNSRFGLDMKSNRDYIYDGDNKPLDVCFQCRLNSTMGQLYVTLLTSVSVRVNVNIAEGESSDKFYEYALNEVMQKYGVRLERAQEILDFMQERSTRCRGSSITLSTVHRFKGDQSDLTILAIDLDVIQRSDDPTEENVKYVACTRPRYGLLQIHEPMYIGNPAPLERLAAFFRGRSWHIGTNSVSQVVNSPVMLIRLMGVPELRSTMELIVKAYHQRICVSATPTEFSSHSQSCHSTQCTTIVGTACDVALMWLVEQKAFRSNLLNILVNYPEFQVSIKDDRKLQAMINQKVIGEELANKYKKLLLRYKLLALMSRYLVARHNFDLANPVVTQGVFACAILQHYSYSKSVLVFRRNITNCSIVDYVNLISNCTLPTLIEDASMWQAVSIHGSIPSSPLNIRGTFDLMIYDKHSKMHIIELKCVKHLKFAHFWQSIMYAVMCQMSGGVISGYSSYVWSLRDNSMFQLQQDYINQITHNLLVHSELFNQAVCCRPDPQFYPKQYDVQDLVF